mmetsp:Transcript_73300/g.203316  ORF Transcript_73300/g.203316 Transcript_73300/m.203316 type:complete len:278 (+) Transcript_73300:1697-2530(+)
MPILRVVVEIVVWPIPRRIRIGHAIGSHLVASVQSQQHANSARCDEPIAGLWSQTIPVFVRVNSADDLREGHMHAIVAPMEVQVGVFLFDVLPLLSFGEFVHERHEGCGVLELQLRSVAVKAIPGEALVVEDFPCDLAVQNPDVVSCAHEALETIRWSGVKAQNHLRGVDLLPMVMPSQDPAAADHSAHLVALLEPVAFHQGFGKPADVIETSGGLHCAEHALPAHARRFQSWRSRHLSHGLPVRRVAEQVAQCPGRKKAAQHERQTPGITVTSSMY